VNLSTYTVKIAFSQRHENFIEFDHQYDHQQFCKATFLTQDLTMAADAALAIKTLELKASCSHCGMECAELKRCSVCKHASYCGAACQNAAWKKHKKKCVTLEEVRNRVSAAVAGREWRVVIKWEGRLEQLLEGRPDAARSGTLNNFKWAHAVAWGATGSTDHAVAAVRLQDRRIEILGNMERFRDQGEAMCEAAGYLVDVGKRQESVGYFQLDTFERAMSEQRTDFSQ